MRLWLSVGAAILLLSTQVSAEEFSCPVKRVKDGDTFSVTCQRYDVRLAEIDAPEAAQPYGDKATAALEALIGGKNVTVHWKETDRYDRFIGVVKTNDNPDVNAEMVRGGHAWVYERYTSGEREEFLKLLQNNAQAQMPPLGLWSLPVSQQIEPEDWRHGKRPAANDNEDQSIAPPGIIGQTPECGTKRTCKQMRDCAEAKAFFSQCKGMQHLDGNKDGVPCADKCRK